jgi:transcriptional regulator with XRE-family HTH domain
MTTSSHVAPEVRRLPDEEFAAVDGQATEALGRHVTKARRVAGLTLASVAQRSGLSTAHVSRIESGIANPTLRTLAQLATALGCAVADLLGADSRTGGARNEPCFITLPLLAATPGHRAVWDVSALGAARLFARLPHGTAGDHGAAASHPGEEIVVALAGTCIVRVGGIAQRLEPGESGQPAALDSHAITELSDDALLLVIMTEE